MSEIVLNITITNDEFYLFISSSVRWCCYSCWKYRQNRRLCVEPSRGEPSRWASAIAVGNGQLQQSSQQLQSNILAQQVVVYRSFVGRYSLYSAPGCWNWYRRVHISYSAGHCSNASGNMGGQGTVAPATCRRYPYVSLILTYVSQYSPWRLMLMLREWTNSSRERDRLFRSILSYWDWS